MATLRSPRQSVSFVVIMYERPLLCVLLLWGLVSSAGVDTVALVSSLSSDYCAHDVIVVYCRKSIFDQRWQDDFVIKHDAHKLYQYIFFYLQPQPRYYPSPMHVSW